MDWLSKPTPAWVTVATGLVALLSLGIAAATYRRAGPRIQMKIGINRERVVDVTRTLLTVRLTNTGLASVQIRRMRISSLLTGFSGVAELHRTSGEIEFGQKLEGGHEVEANFDLGKITKAEVQALAQSGTFRLALYRAGMPRLGPFVRWRSKSSFGWRLVPIFDVRDSVEVDLGNGVEISRKSLPLSVEIRKLVREGAMRSVV